MNSGCLKEKTAPEELFDAYSTIELDTSGIPAKAISQRGFALPCQHTRRVAI